MENVNIRRITIAGEIDNVSQTCENEVYTYKVGIRKVDGGVWNVNISEDLYLKLL